jgi:hypothetical protein
MDNLVNNADNKRLADETLPRVAIYEDQETRAEDEREVRVVTSGVNSYDTAAHEEVSDQSPDELEHSIERTQERIAERIDELSKRLSPTHIKDQAVQTLNDSLNITGLQHMVKDLRGVLGDGAKDSSAKILEGVKHNPLSVALMGVGVGVVALGGAMAVRTDSKTYSPRTVKRPYDERLRGMMDTIEGGYENSHHDSKISKTVQDAKQMVSDNAHKAKDGLSHVIDAQPLAVGAVALLAGAAVGLLLPRTRYEDSVMGERSDQLISQAKGKASEVVDVAKSTVSDVLQTAKDTASEVVQTAKEAAKDTARSVTA